MAAEMSFGSSKEAFLNLVELLQLTLQFRPLLWRAMLSFWEQLSKLAT